MIFTFRPCQKRDRLSKARVSFPLYGLGLSPVYRDDTHIHNHCSRKRKHHPVVVLEHGIHHKRKSIQCCYASNQILPGSSDPGYSSSAPLSFFFFFVFSSFFVSLRKCLTLSAADGGRSTLSITFPLPIRLRTILAPTMNVRTNR